MAGVFGKLKLRTLNENETRGTLSSWIESLIFLISNDPKFSRFIDDMKEWKSPSRLNRGFMSDDAEINGSKMTAANKTINLKVLLGFISIHAPVISSSFIKEEALSLEEIFQRLREYYDCQKSGSKITELLSFRLGALESREAIWERIYSFIEDNLITKASGIQHKGAKVENDERMTPTILNIAVVIWLDAIHNGLPALVKQRFAIPLRSTTIYSIRTEISDAIPSLLIELGDKEGSISYSSSYPRDKRNKPERYNKIRPKTRPRCCICEAASRPGADTHYFQSCPFMPLADKKFLKSKIGEVEILSDSESDDNEEYLNASSKSVKVRAKKDTNHSCKVIRVDIISSPYMDVNINNK